MIQIQKLTLFNFCQFHTFTLSMTTGLTKISGPNGSGKTTVFRALVYGLTGWCDPSWGTQTDLQKDDEPIPGFVSLDLLVDGEVYTLKRFTGSGTKLNDTLCKDDKIIVKNRKAVNSWLEDRLSLPVGVLAQLMWLRQENASWLLTATASQLNQFLGLIFNTKKLEDLRKPIKEACDQIPKIYAETEDAINSMESDLSRLIQSKAAVETSISSLETSVQEAKAELMKFDTGGMSKAEKETSMSSLSSQIKSLLSQIALLGDMQEVKPPDNAVLEDAKQEVNDQDSICGNAESSIACTQRLLQDNLKVQERLQQMKIPSSCELCGSVLKDDVAKTYLDKKASVVFGSNICYESTLHEVSDTVSKLQTDLEDMNAVYSEAKQELELKQAALDRLLRQQTDALAYAQYVQTKCTLQTSLDALVNELKRVSAIEPYIGAENRDAAASAVKELTDSLQSSIQQRDSLIGSIAALETSIRTNRNNLVLAKRNEKARDLLSMARDILSQSRAQARYLNSKIDSLNADVEHYLSMSEMPFTLYLDKEDHTFKYKMQGSDTPHQAGMLSGAQKAAAAIAIQMSLVTTAAPDLTTLLVDEADASLSQENKFIAARLYRTLSQSLSGISGSVLIISQSDAVASECDREVDVTITDT